MTPQEKVLSIASAQVGVKESPAGSNRVLYNTWYWGREVSGPSYPWCCALICWVFAQAGMSALVKRTAGCTTMMNWFKARGRIVPTKEAKPGDLVFYQFNTDAYSEHIGIVESVTKDGVVAIEGNTSLTSNDNGGSVMRRTRRWGLIMAVARPAWETIKKEDEVDMSKDEVKALVAQEVAAAVKTAMGNAKGKVYNTVGECPAWGREAVQWAVDSGAIKGDQHGKLGLDDTKVWAIQVAYNIEHPAD